MTPASNRHEDGPHRGPYNTTTLADVSFVVGLGFVLFFRVGVYIFVLFKLVLFLIFNRRDGFDGGLGRRSLSRNRSADAWGIIGHGFLRLHHEVSSLASRGQFGGAGVGGFLLVVF